MSPNTIHLLIQALGNEIQHSANIQWLTIHSFFSFQGHIVLVQLELHQNSLDFMREKKFQTVID